MRNQNIGRPYNHKDSLSPREKSKDKKKLPYLAKNDSQPKHVTADQL